MNGVAEVVVNREVADSRAKPLLIYADRKSEGGAAS